MARTALNLIMPPSCPLTGEIVPEPGMVSPRAWATLHFIEAPYCDHCGIPFAADLGEGMICPACIADPPVFDRARAALSYSPMAGKLISGFKFSDRTDLAPMLARWMARAGSEVMTKETVVTPVPLHWRRLAARRFNQSAVLAKEIARLTGAQMAQRLLTRTRSTPPQRELESAAARRRNVAGAFVVNRKMRLLVEGAHCLLIDDVLTTGATLSAAARALKKAGAARVDALVLARVVKGGVGAI